MPLRQRERGPSLPDGGSRQRFQNGTLYKNPKLRTVFALWGEIEARYRKLGEATSACGYPTSSVTEQDGVQTVTFDRGTIRLDGEGRSTVDCS